MVLVDVLLVLVSIMMFFVWLCLCSSSVMCCVELGRELNEVGVVMLMNLWSGVIRCSLWCWLCFVFL